MARQRKSFLGKTRPLKPTSSPIWQKKSQSPQPAQRPVEWVRPGILCSTAIPSDRGLTDESVPQKARDRPSIIPENHRDFRFGSTNQKPKYRPRDRMNHLRSTEQEERDSAERAIIERRRIYLGNLPYEAKPSDVKDLLMKYRLGMAVDQIHFSFDRFMGRGPGYCFIEFKDTEGACSALDTLPGKILRGREIKCNSCEYKGHNLAGSRNDDVGSHAFKRWEYFSGDFKDDPVRYHHAMPRLFVGNLSRPHDHAMAYNEMLEFFSGFEIVDVSKRYPSRRVSSDAGEGGRFYYQHVIFASQEQAQAAWKAKQNKTWRGAVLKVDMVMVQSNDEEMIWMLDY